MLTGDFLFEPRKGPTFGKDDDHLAQMEELLKKFPKKFLLAGKNSKRYLDTKANLRRIPQLHYWPLRNVLIEKYHIREDEAKLFDSFIQPMLRPQPIKRASARDMLFHPWLSAPPNLHFKYTEQEFQKYQTTKSLLAYDDIHLSCNEAEDSDICDADTSFVSDLLKEDDN